VTRLRLSPKTAYGAAIGRSVLVGGIGSELPGGYSTVIIRPSLPGRFVSSFDMSCVTLASCATSVLEMRHTSAKIPFANVIN
jgi:hypothetical protein